MSRLIEAGGASRKIAVTKKFRAGDLVNPFFWFRLTCASAQVAIEDVLNLFHRRSWIFLEQAERFLVDRML